MGHLQDIVVPVTVENAKFTVAHFTRRGGERVRKVESLLWFSGCNPICLVKEIKKLQPPAVGSGLTFSFSYIQIVSEQEELVSSSLFSADRQTLLCLSLKSCIDTQQRVWLL
jgi:hypothetical protein